MRKFQPCFVGVTKQLLATTFLLFLSVCVFSQKKVTGKVSDIDAKPITGATVSVKGTNTAISTSADGEYSILIPQGKNTLVISYVGYESTELTVGAAQSNLDVILKLSKTDLNEIVVTGYTTQRKKDIIGAVSVVNTKDLLLTPSSNLAVQLQGRAAGVTVSSSGEPGAGAVVRIRGFASAGNNDPLYIIDGVPTGDPSTLNPNDIESLQVLKDASSASIYGARASNGVVIITTKQGKAGRSSLTYDAYIGSQVITEKMMPEMLNTTQYLDYLQRTTDASYTHPVFGKNGAFTIPEFYITSGPFKGGVTASDAKANPDLYTLTGNVYQISKTSLGTNWFKELTQPALFTNHQITATGGSDKAAYSLGVNYFDQKGTFVNTSYKRYSLRANTSFKPVSFLRIGENFQFTYEDRLGGSNRGEGDAWASAFRMVPYIPVMDIKGGWGGNGVGVSGNGSNPIANLARAKDNTNRFSKIFGNVFAEIPFTNYLTARTSLGIDMGSQFVRNIGRKTYERSENQGTTQLTEEGWNFLNWTWTNTLTFQHIFATDHDLKVLVGSEAIKSESRGVRAFGQNFDFETPDFVSLNSATAGSLSDRTISNYNVGRSSLYSLFGRLDYAFKGKYLLTGTFRRDGSSRFGPNVRYANFPSFGAAWRVSEEGFLKSVSWITDLKLRAGWGQMGSQSNVEANNQFFTFISNAPRTNYDISGSNTSSAQGYRQDREGNLDTKWETSETTNIGLDATLFNGKLDVSLDVYTKDTKDLLVDKILNGLEPQLTKPRINIGTMRNKGFDILLNYRGKSNKDFSYDLGVTFSHYKNTMTKLNNENAPRIIDLERLNGAVRTELGQPISSFHGFVIDGFYNSAKDTIGAIMPGATIGSWRYKDLNNDGKITDADRTFLGSPHPDFQMGFNLGATWKNFNFSAFLFWNQGNEIYNYTKYYTDMRVFIGGVSTRVLNDSWTPSNMANAKLPLLAPGSANGYTSFTSSTSNSYYVEDGSYLRLKTIQLGYALPKSLIKKIKLSNARIYIQAQNLFTFTKYTGSDPDISLISRDPFGARDYYIGVDLGGFPNPKQFLAGLSVTF